MRPSASVHLCAVRVSLSTGEPSISAIPIKPAAHRPIRRVHPNADGTTSFESHVDRRLPSSMLPSIRRTFAADTTCSAFHDCRLSYVLRGRHRYSEAPQRPCSACTLHRVKWLVPPRVSRHCPARPVTTLAVGPLSFWDGCSSSSPCFLRSYTWSKTSSRGQN